MRKARLLAASLAAALLTAASANAAVWDAPVVLEGEPFGQTAQIAVNDDGEVVTLLERNTPGAPRLDWLSADGKLQSHPSRSGLLGSAGDGTMFLLSGHMEEDTRTVRLATKPPGLPFGPDVVIADGPVGPMDVNSAGDIAMVLGHDLGLLRRGAATVERIDLPDNAWFTFSDIELTDAGEILAARRSGTDREVVIVPPGGAPRVERVGGGGGCDFQIAAGPDGRAIAAWNPPTVDYGCEGGQNYASLRPAGGSFSQGAPVPGLPQQTEPHIAVDTNGRAVLAYDSTHPTGVKAHIVLLTAGPSDTAWTTSTSFVGYSDGIASSPAGVWLAYGSGFYGPKTGRVTDAGTLEDVQDVIADCRMSPIAFNVAPAGRAAMLGWRYDPQHYGISRQVPGTAAPRKCGLDMEEDPKPPSPSPPPPPLFVKPPAKAQTTVTATARRASGRRVVVRFTRSDTGQLTTSGTLRVAGRRPVKAKASGTTVVNLTFRVPARTWRALTRKGARLTLKAASPEGGSWTFKRTVKR